MGRYGYHPAWIPVWLQAAGHWLAYSTEHFVDHLRLYDRNLDGKLFIAGILPAS